MCAFLCSVHLYSLLKTVEKQLKLHATLNCECVAEMLALKYAKCSLAQFMQLFLIQAIDETELRTVRPRP